MEGPSKFKVLLYGVVSVNISVKSIAFEKRIQLANRCIQMIVEAHGMHVFSQKEDVNQDFEHCLSINRSCTFVPIEALLMITDTSVKVESSADTFFSHDLALVSFAACGNGILNDFFCYVAKDPILERVCLVFQSPSPSDAATAVSALGNAFQVCFSKFKNERTKPICPIDPPPRANTNDEINLINLDQPIILPPPRIPNRTLLLDDQSQFNDHQLVSLEEKPSTEILCDNLEPIGQPWYVGKISRAEAESLLVREGDFLVRASTKDSGQFILSGYWAQNYIHLLLVDSDGQVRSMNCQFKNIEELVQFHVSKQNPICSGGKQLHLIRPVTMEHH